MLYNTFSRPVFVLGVGLIIAPCFVGRLRVIRGFLGAELFAFLAKLTYVGYLIHCLVIMWMKFDTRQAFYVNWVEHWYFSIGIMVITFMMAIPISLM